MQTSQRYIIGSAALGVVGYAAFQVVSLVRRVDDSERKLHALICVANVMEDYLKSSGRVWPASWTDLHRTSVAHQCSMYRWPDHADKVGSLVEIDFDVTVDELDRPDFDVSSAIRPRGEYIYDPSTRLSVLQHFIVDYPRTPAVTDETNAR